jgi:hypothetical protein
MRELKRQLIYYRPGNRGGHDDGPDALEMLLGLCEAGLHGAACATPPQEKPDYHAQRPERGLMGRMFGRGRR